MTGAVDPPAAAVPPWVGGTAARPPRAWSVRPAGALAVAVGLMLFGNLGRVPVLLRGPELPVVLNDVVVGVVLAVGGLACLQARRLLLDSVCAAAGLFAAIGAGAMVASAVQYHLTAADVVQSATYLARWVAYAGVYVVIVNCAAASDAERLWRVLERTAVWFAAFGVFQSLFLPGFAQLIYPEGGDYVVWDAQGHRMVSTMLDPNFAGAFVALPLLVHAARGAFGVPVPRWRVAVLLASLAMTVSRSSVLATVVGFAVILAVRGVDRRMIRAAGFTLLAALPFVPFLVRFAASYQKFSIDSSAMARVVMWLRAIQIFSDHPVFGIGFNTYRAVQRAYGWDGDTLSTLSNNSLDGGLLFIAVLTGTVGVAVYAGMLTLVVRRCRRLWREASLEAEARGTALGVAACTAAMVVHSIFVNSLLQNFLMESLWVLWGIVALHARRVSAGRAPRPQPDAGWRLRSAGPRITSVPTVAFRAAGALLVAGALSGCAECAGVRPCEGTPTVSATVRFVDYETGRPVSGVRARLVRTAGALIRPDSVEATSGSDGFVTFRAEAERLDAITVDVAVAPPAPRPAYRVRGYELRATQGRGDGQIIGRWSVDPFVEFVGEMRFADGGPVGDARVTFIRRSGPRLRPDTVIGATEPGGRFFLRARGSDVGDAVGDLRVEGGPLGTARVLRDVRLPVTVSDQSVRLNEVFALPGGAASDRHPAP